MSSTMAASRVNNPIISRAPQTISHPQMNGPMISGAGTPIFVSARPQAHPDKETSEYLLKEKRCQPKAARERSRQVRWLPKGGENIFYIFGVNCAKS
jgi:hypothetical protein